MQGCKGASACSIKRDRPSSSCVRVWPSCAFLPWPSRPQPQPWMRTQQPRPMATRPAARLLPQGGAPLLSIVERIGGLYVLLHRFIKHYEVMIDADGRVGGCRPAGWTAQRRWRSSGGCAVQASACLLHIVCLRLGWGAEAGPPLRAHHPVGFAPMCGAPCKLRALAARPFPQDTQTPEPSIPFPWPDCILTCPTSAASCAPCPRPMQPVQATPPFDVRR